MNEWSPGGNYSRPATPNQTGRSFRSQWDEPEKGTKPLVVNIRTVSENRNASYQQLSMEDVSKSFISTGSKNKKVGNGSSDPRFKRVISPGMQNSACVGTDSRKPKPEPAPSENLAFKPKDGVWDPPEFKPNKPCVDIPEFIPNKPSGDAPVITEQIKPTAEIRCEPPEIETPPATEPVDQQDNLKAVDKLSFSHDVIKSLSKESLSDCTVNTRNTSLASEDAIDEFTNDLSGYPPTARVKKVQNWIQEQKCKPEKKQSVITVIGQTQGQDNLSSALREIDKRKKLVKELDKYAVCKKVIDTDKEKEISELVAKINFLSNVGRIMFNQKKSEEENPSALKSSSEKLEKHEPPDTSPIEKLLSLSSEVNSDPSSPGFLSRKRSSSKKKSKKSQSECYIKGKIREILNNMQYQWVFCFMVVLSGVLCWITFVSIQNGAYVSLDLFTPKPKPLTWYEKICMWIWEIFRPSNNYRRVAPWHSY